MKCLMLSLIISLFSVSAIACPGGEFNYKELTLRADAISAPLGIETPDGEKRAEFKPVLGLTFSVMPSPPGGSSWVEVIGQHRDDGGILNTTYALKSKVVYPGAKERVKRIRIHSNYHGNGIYAKGGCSVEELP